MRGDGEIAETGITVYIMKYTKEVRKKFKEYGTCNLADINSVGAIEASYYEGQYFFNGIEPGKYFIKVCSLFGNYMVINREDSYQKIEMKVMPILTIFVALIVVGVLLWLINKYVPMDAKIKTIINVVAVIIVIVWLLEVFGILGALKSARV